MDDRILRRLKLSDLRLFHTVVERGGMAKAAAHLNISQPAVSKAIAALEATLRVRLLDRNSQGVEPTAYGLALLDGSVAVFDELIKSVKQIEYLTDPTVGELRVGCTEFGAAGWVPAIISRLSGKYPRVVFRVTTADPVTLSERDLPQRRIELALGALPVPPPTGDIEATILFDAWHFVMAGEGNKWVRRRNLKLADLLHEPWILPPPESLMGTHIANAFRGYGLEPPQSQVVSFSIPLLHQLLATGRFLAMHPVGMPPIGKHFRLRRLDVDFVGIHRPIGIMTLGNRSLSPLARVFIECAGEMAKALSQPEHARPRDTVRTRR